ncbi:MAG: asparaginase, partial [Symbiobacteriaceae bacterium]|nr:asparaginase [Symbiobacteriaceae bacterium]
MSLPTIAMLATGGTIAGRGSDPTRSTDYRPGMASVEELLEAVPGLENMVQIEAEQFSNLGSSGLTNQHLINMAKRLTEVLAQEHICGAIVTHGTDVLEETAYFLNISVKSAKPIVVTGSMRPSTAISADGPANILASVRTAIHPESVGRGVLVVLNDEIHAARDVTKSHAQRVHTFVSRELGPLGVLTGDRIDYYRTSQRQHTFDTPFDIMAVNQLPRVDLVTTHIDNDSVAIDAYLAAGAQGIVVAAAGGGATTPGMTPGLQRAAAAGVKIVLATRTGSGMVRGWNRGERQAIGAGTLNPYKARLLLSLALAHTQDSAIIQEWFNRF